MSGTTRRASVAVAATVLGATVLSAAAIAAPAVANGCPPSTAGGRAIATINMADGTQVLAKPVSYPRGGVLTPPPSNRVAGISTRHQPIEATQGTTVIVWHVRYGPGCDGTLNPLLSHPVGQTFTVTPRGGEPTDYVIVRERTVRKGRYEPSWFRPDGPRRLLLATCSDLAGGAFRKTTVLFAKPVVPMTDPGSEGGAS